MSDLGLGLRRTAERAPALDALAAEPSLTRVGLGTLFHDSPRRGRRGFTWARSVRRTHTFDRADRRDARWWPQGVAWPEDDRGAPEASHAGRRVVALTWYAKALGADPRGGHGCRITFYDVTTRRYEHALVVVPTIDEQGVTRAAPLRVHAGGLVWAGGHLHVAATAKGFHTCRLSDLLQVRADGTPPARLHTAGHRYLLPVHHSWQPTTAKGTEPLRYSFLSYDPSASGRPPALLVGEYGRAQQTRRLVWFPLDEATGLPLADADGAVAARRVAVGVRNMQGAVVVDGDLVVTSSRGARTPGSLLHAPLGGPVTDLGTDAFTERRWATPIGPEDLAVHPRDRSLWTITEHPGRRWLVELRTP